MGAYATVMFADLTGSTAVFEQLGNVAATRAITRLTDWIREVCRDHGGHVVKTLGDGVLVLFPSEADAVEAVVQLQRERGRLPGRRGLADSMQLRIGLASGEVIERADDCFGDAVNVASRLSDLSGARQILATAAVVDQLASAPPGARFHPLGPMRLRGREQPCHVFRIDWQADSSTEMMTMPAFDSGATMAGARAGAGGLRLAYGPQAQEFGPAQFPVHIGRGHEAEFVVADRRVSRVHARIDRHDDAFLLLDLSSNGTGVRFQGAPTQLTLRRDNCVLHDNGEIVLGPDGGDSSVPTVRFELMLR